MELLGRHVVDRAEEVARGRQVRVGAREARQAEVGQVGVLTAEQDVGRLDVAMDQPRRVRGVQRARDLVDDQRRPQRVQPALGAQQLVQVGAGHPAHHQVQPAVLLACLVDRDDVRMIDRRGHPRLALEALAEARVGGVLGGDQLQRDRAPERELGGAVDDAHATASGDRLDPAARDMSAFEDVGHASQCDEPRRGPNRSQQRGRRRARPANWRAGRPAATRAGVSGGTPGPSRPSAARDGQPRALRVQGLELELEQRRAGAEAVQMRGGS